MRHCGVWADDARRSVRLRGAIGARNRAPAVDRPPDRKEILTVATPRQHAAKRLQAIDGRFERPRPARSHPSCRRPRGGLSLRRRSACPKAQIRAPARGRERQCRAVRARSLRSRRPRSRAAGGPNTPPRQARIRSRMARLFTASARAAYASPADQAVRRLFTRRVQLVRSVSSRPVAESLRIGG